MSPVRVLALLVLAVCGVTATYLDRLSSEELRGFVPRQGAVIGGITLLEPHPHYKQIVALIETSSSATNDDDIPDDVYSFGSQSSTEDGGSARSLRSSWGEGFSSDDASSEFETMSSGSSEDSSGSYGSGRAVPLKNHIMQIDPDVLTEGVNVDSGAEARPSVESSHGADESSGVSTYESAAKQFGATLSRRLGGGSFGNVWKVSMPDGSLRALKFLKTIKSEEAWSVVKFKECDVPHWLRKGQEQHVMDCYESKYFPDSNEAILLLELCEGTSLREYIQNKAPIDVSTARDILRQLVGVIRAMGESGFDIEDSKTRVVRRHRMTHHDLKPENLMVYDDSHGRPRIKVIDFGGAIECGAEVMEKQWSAHYTDPDCFRDSTILGEPYRDPCYSYDLNAAGFIFYELVSGEKFWTPINGVSLIAKAQGMYQILNYKQAGNIPAYRATYDITTRLRKAGVALSAEDAALMRLMTQLRADKRPSPSFVTSLIDAIDNFNEGCAELPSSGHYCDTAYIGDVKSHEHRPPPFPAGLDRQGLPATENNHSDDDDDDDDDMMLPLIPPRSQ